MNIIAASLPDGSIKWVGEACTFSMEDNPDQLAGVIREFAG
ncbi:MAG: hypothetical protein ACSLFD_06880 [Solirubrobacterales bacterium]